MMENKKSFYGDVDNVRTYDVIARAKYMEKRQFRLSLFAIQRKTFTYKIVFWCIEVNNL